MRTNAREAAAAGTTASLPCGRRLDSRRLAAVTVQRAEAMTAGSRSHVAHTVAIRCQKLARTLPPLPVSAAAAASPAPGRASSPLALPRPRLPEAPAKRPPIRAAGPAPGGSGPPPAPAPHSLFNWLLCNRIARVSPTHEPTFFFYNVDGMLVLLPPFAPNPPGHARGSVLPQAIPSTRSFLMPPLKPSFTPTLGRASHSRGLLVL